MNRSIDDENGDSVTGAKPTYLPDEGWSQGAQCPGCHVHPGLVDVSLAFDQTWHDGTYHPGQPDRVITVSFTGTAVYVYNLIANVIQYTTTLTNLSFSVDGTYIQQYVHAPDGSEAEILYSVLVFSHTGLSNQPHTLEMRATGPNDSLILFDTVLYTVPEVPTTLSVARPSSTTPLPISSTSTIAAFPSVSEPSTSHQSTSPTTSYATSSVVTTRTDPGIGLTTSSTASEPNTQPGGTSITSVVQSPNPYSGVSGTSEPSETPRDSSVAIEGGHPLSVGSIIGIVAGLIGFGMIVALFLCFRRQYRRGIRFGSPPDGRSTPKARAGSAPTTTMNMSSPLHAIAVTPREVLHVSPRPASQRQGHPFASEYHIPSAGSLSPASGRFLRLVQRGAATSGPTASELDLAASVASELKDDQSQRTGSSLAIRALHSQVASLQEQLDRLRHMEHDMHELLWEPPPRYEDHTRGFSR
ncbi:hypothetical protein GY45DRAFT_1328505 [Cubamyces sp. BRFM 1775]|nr:hypothetical protein GY45DRAFT_1328505 [Cubamyces sp. BRFM 1775]